MNCCGRRTNCDCLAKTPRSRTNDRGRLRSRDISRDVAKVFSVYLSHFSIQYSLYFGQDACVLPSQCRPLFFYFGFCNHGWWVLLDSFSSSWNISINVYSLAPVEDATEPEIVATATFSESNPFGRVSPRFRTPFQC